MGKVFVDNIWVIIGMAVFSILAAAMETAGIAAIAPLLNISTSVTQSLPFPFNASFLFFNNLDMMHKLQFIALVMVLTTIVKNVFFYGNILCCTRLRSAVVQHYRMACMHRVIRVGLGYLNRKRASDIQKIFDGHIDDFIGMIVESAGSIMPYIFTLCVLVFFLFAMSVKLTILSLLLAGFSLLILSGLSKKIGKSGSNYVEHKFIFSRILLDILHGMKIVRLFGREQFMEKEFEKRGHDYNGAYAHMTRVINMTAPLFEICGVFILGTILLAGSWMVIKNPSVYSTLLIFILIWVRIIPPVKALNQTRGAVVARLPALREVHAFLNEANEESLTNGSVQFQSIANSIEFKNVSFRYTPHTPVVLNEINFTVKKGMRIGIVGASGSGKSTLSELLLRFYDPETGQVLIDGKDIKELDIVSWRRLVGVVTQDTFLFHDTVRANIAFANPNVTDAMIMQAARRAHAHEFIQELSHGYETRIGDRGVLLSGGQRQRIAIARAILNEPQILIFDEATSALDSESEKYVQAALDEVSQQKTVITIAHRLSTVMHSDWIVVLDKGRIVEQGTGSQLLGQNGFYKKLVDMQSLGWDQVQQGAGHVRAGKD